MNKLFYYFYLISLIVLFYLFGFLTFKYDLYPKTWLNGSINSLIKDLDESKRNFLLNSLKIISENKDSNEFQYSVRKNSNQFKNNPENQFSGYMLLSFEDDTLGSLNFSLYKNPVQKAYSWSFKDTIKPTVMLHVFPNGNALIYNDEFISLISSDSKEIWRLKKVVHHWGSIKENKLYIPGRKYVNYPEDLDISSKKLNIGKCKVKNALADTILEIDIKKGSIIREIDLLPIILFIIIFLWTPPHFWSLALVKTEDYKKANIPMMPNVVGESSTKKQILFYSFLLLISSLSPFILGLTGYIYFFGSFTMNLGFCVLSIGLIIFPNRKLEIPLFIYSIFYLFGIFVLLVIDKYFVV